MATLSYTERPFTRLDATYQTPYLWFEATDLKEVVAQN